MPQHAESGSGRFVGRAGELRLVDDVCKRALDGRGGLVVVSGEAGIGKTRFCEEAAGRARGHGLRVVTARCWDEGGAPPLWPWQPILNELCGPDAAGLLAVDSGTDTAVDPDRFARFVAVTDRLANACEARPTYLVVDDVQSADSGTLLLTRFVARSLPGLRLVLVLSRRSTVPADEVQARLLDEIERDAIATLPLHRFDVAETQAFLAAHGFGDCDPDLLDALTRVTGGNPLFLRRITALGAVDPRQALPTGLRAAIDTAVDGLRPHTRRVLETSAVLGRTPSIGEAAALTGLGLADVLDALGEATAVGLVGVEPTERFAFTHEMVRAALEDRLPPDDRLEAHHAAAALVAGATSSEALARRAYHLLRVAPRSAADAGRAVASCREAARAMVGSFAYEQADALLSAAVGLHVPTLLGAAPADLLVEWADAALLCGRLAEARVRFDQAGAVAEHEGDPAVFADAALGMGGVWVAERRSAVTRSRVLAQQRAALAGLPEDEVVRRCRLRMRLAAEAVYDGGPPDAVQAALADVRRCGDPEALAEALSLTHHTMLEPEHAHTRLELAEEMIRVASEAGLGVLSLMGLCWRAVDLFLLGDPRASRALEELRERADTLASENILYMVDVLDVMLLIRAGRLDEAEAEATACHSRGTAVGDVDAFGYLGAHMLAIRWIQGRGAELADLADEIAASPTLVLAEFAFEATAAAFAASAGRTDRARAGLDHLAADGLARLPPSSTWFIGLFAIVEAAAALGDAAIAAQAYDLLLPYADLPVMPSLAVACVGSAQRPLGVAAAIQGDWDGAATHFEQAVAANRRLGHRPLVAITKADLARALWQRADVHGGDADRAATLLRDALGEAEAMGMTGRVDAWRTLQAQAEVARPAGPAELAGREHLAVGPPASHPPRTTAAEAPPTGVIRREGHGWVIGVGARRTFVGDLVGMAYLAELLTRPGETITAVELAAGDPAFVDTSGQELLDDSARAAYVREARDLAEALADAEANHDIERSSKLRVEIDVLVDHIESATGLGGRSRRFTSTAERARTAVRKAIKRAIDHIEAGDPDLARHLTATVATGTTCMYTSDPRRTIHWFTQD